MRRSPLKTALCLVPPALLAAALLCTGTLRLASLRDGRDGYAGKQVVLNEVCAKNLTVLVDDSTRTDWVELYNPTDEAFDFTGCFLSNKKNEVTLWQFPEGTVLPGGAYLVLQADGTGVGLHPSFKLRGEGDTLYLTGPDGTLLDSLHYPALSYDITYGRRALDGSTDGLFAIATPGTTNPADYWQREVATAALGTVHFSQTGGFYDDAFGLTLTSDDPDALILYTLDGSEPDTGSEFYTAPLPLTPRNGEANRYVSLPSILDDGYWLKNYAVAYAPEPVAKATTVTARLYKDGVLGEAVRAETYWLGSDAYTLPVLSITGQAEDLFGRYGIYLPGSTYFTLRRFGITGYNSNTLSGEKVDVRAELLDTDGTPLLQDTGTLKVSGGLSRSVSTKKSLQLRLDQATPALLPGAGALGSYTVRGSGGGSVHFSLFKDAFINNYLFGSAAGDSLGVRYNRPVILFLQDEYWGIYTLRERLTDDFFAQHFGVAVDAVQRPEADEPEDEAAMLALATEIDALEAGSEAAYRWADETFDLDNYCEWLIAQMYTGNLDGLYSGGNNTVLWRTTRSDAANPYADGRWRFALNDFDATLFDDALDPIAPLLAEDYTPTGPRAKSENWYCAPCLLFQKLWGNETFRTRFCAAAREAMATAYAPDAILPAFNEWCEMLRPELAQDLARQQILPNRLAGLGTALTASDAPEARLTLEEWEQNVAGLRLYFERRANTFLAALPA